MRVGAHGVEASGQDVPHGDAPRYSIGAVLRGKCQMSKLKDSEIFWRWPTDVILCVWRW